MGNEPTSKKSLALHCSGEWQVTFINVDLLILCKTLLKSFSST